MTLDDDDDAFINFDMDAAIEQHAQKQQQQQQQQQEEREVEGEQKWESYQPQQYRPPQYAPQQYVTDHLARVGEENTNPFGPPSSSAESINHWNDLPVETASRSHSSYAHHADTDGAGGGMPSGVGADLGLAVDADGGAEDGRGLECLLSQSVRAKQWGCCCSPLAYAASPFASRHPHKPFGV